MTESDDDLWARIQREQIWRNRFRGFCLSCGKPSPTDPCDSCLEAEHRELIKAEARKPIRTEIWVVRIAACVAIALLLWAATKNETPSSVNQEPRPTFPTGVTR